MFLLKKKILTAFLFFFPLFFHSCDNCGTGQYKASSHQDGRVCNTCNAGRFFDGDYSSIDINKVWIGWCDNLQFVLDSDNTIGQCVRCNTKDDCSADSNCMGSVWCNKANTVLCGKIFFLLEKKRRKRKNIYQIYFH